MRFFLDTANLGEITKALSWGVVSGVTTNPTLVGQEGTCDFYDRIRAIAELVDGPVSAEAVGTDTLTLVQEGCRLAALHREVVVKIPMCPQGLGAVLELTKKGIKTNVTLVFSLQQALLAAAAGADYVSPFIGRMEDTGADGITLIRDISSVFNLQNIKTKIIAASIRNTYHVHAAALAGAHYATVPPAVLEQLFFHPLTEKGINRFNADWEAYRKNNG